MVVVGASLAGVRAAESLRDAGYDGALTVVGAEGHRPYDRPPLSKQVLTGKVEPGQIALDVGHLDCQWLLGTAAIGLDLQGRRVRLEGDENLAFDGLVIATGARARSLPGVGRRHGLHLLRTLDDAIALRRQLERSPAVAVVGAGFIGAEVASSCRQRGLTVTVVEVLPVPLSGAIGEEMGRAAASLHQANGTSLITGVGVESILGGDRVEGLRLADGRTVAADVVVVGVGVAPEQEWLQGSGVDLDNGVLCDQWCRVLSGGNVVPGVVACGDVARWRHPLWERPVRVEHWTNAVEQGEAAGRALLHGDMGRPYAPVPYFWSDQYGVKIQMVGRFLPGDQVRVVDGSVDDHRFVAAYGRHGRLVGAIGFGRPARVMKLRQMIAAGAPWPPAL